MAVDTPVSGVPWTSGAEDDMTAELAARNEGANAEVDIEAAMDQEATARNAAITAAVNALLDAAPGALDTLNELAAALGDDPNFATTVTNALATKKLETFTGWTAGRHYRLAGNQSAVVLTQNRLTYLPFLVPKAGSFDQVNLSVTGAASGSTILVGIYGSTADHRPGTLIQSLGTVNGNSATVQAIALSPAWAPAAGLYWLGAVAQGGTPTALVVSTALNSFGSPIQSNTSAAAVLGANPNPYYEAGVTGALPSTATPVTDNTVTQAIAVAARAA